MSVLLSTTHGSSPSTWGAQHEQGFHLGDALSTAECVSRQGQEHECERERV